jgi:hypothetical protein
VQGNDKGPGLLLVVGQVMDGIILFVIVVKIHRLGLVFVFVAAIPRGCVIVFLRVHLAAQVCAIAGTCRTTLSRLLGDI